MIRYTPPKSQIWGHQVGRLDGETIVARCLQFLDDNCTSRGIDIFEVGKLSPRSRSLEAFCVMTTTLYFLVVYLSVCHAAACREPEHEVDGEVVRVASKLLLDVHLRKGIDPRHVANAWGRRHLLSLDPRRMHFLSSDENELLEQAQSLLVDTQNENVEFPLLVAKRFRERLDANALSIAKLLDEEHDFNIDESVQIEHQNYAFDKIASDERWRLRIKHELLMENPNDPNAQSSRVFLRGR